RAGSCSRWLACRMRKRSRRCASRRTSCRSRPASWAATTWWREAAMHIDKVRALSDAELDTALRDAKRDLWQARFALSTRQLKEYSSIPLTRRTIARILTVQRERDAERQRSASL